MIRLSIVVDRCNLGGGGVSVGTQGIKLTRRIEEVCLQFEKLEKLFTTKASRGVCLTRFALGWGGGRRREENEKRETVCSFVGETRCHNQ